MTLAGKIEGQPVTFTLISQEGRTAKFRAEVPSTLDGEYVVELTAIDDAGNVAYTCRYLVTIDMSRLCVHLVPLPDYWLEPVQAEYDLVAVAVDYWLEPIYPECKLDLGVRI